MTIRFTRTESRQTWANSLNALVALVLGKQDALVSASTIKTINGDSVLGSGDLTVSGMSATTIEQNLGAPAWRGKFTITDPAIEATSKVLCWQAPGPYTGKGTRADEAEMQPVQVVAVVPAAGSAVVYWQTPPQIAVAVMVNDSPRLHPAGATFDRLDNQRWPVVITPSRIGKVRGNVKFSYSVFP